MRKKSVLLLILISFWFAYSTYSIGMYFYNEGQAYQEEIERRKGLIDFYLDLSGHFLMNQKVEALIPRLDKARELREFDFYLLRKNDEVLAFYNKDNFLEGINHDYEVLDQFQETDDLALKTSGIYDYKITIGINKAYGSFLWDQFAARKSLIAQGLILTTLLVVFIVFINLKDILSVARILQSRSRSSVAGIRSRSKEGETLIQATEGYEKTSRELKGRNLLLASNLAPAIQEEIQSGKTPPYDFACTLVRVDLNGYTQLFLQSEPQELSALLSPYFERSRDLIERYGGLIYQYVGDETIFFIKGEESEVTTAKALSAIRSLFETAKEIKSAKLPEGLRLKASMVAGRLQFIRLEDGHAFAGLPLIESVRMLGQVSEKTENSLIFYADSLSSVRPFCEVNSTKTAVFKGFQRESHLLEVRIFTNVEQAFESLPLHHIGEFFRSDSDLIQILMRMRDFVKESQHEPLIHLIASLRKLNLRETHPLVFENYLKLLEECLQKGQDRLEESKVLSTVVSLSQTLLQPGTKNSLLEKFLNRCEEAKDPRVQANTILSKAYLGLKVERLSEKAKSSSNRLAADSILIAGQQNFDQNLADRIDEFLQSKNPRFIASALFLIAELISYYHRQDRVYLETNTFLKSLAIEVPKFMDHSDVMVKSRAVKSYQQIQKLGFYEN